MASLTEAARALERLRGNREALERLNVEGDFLDREDLSDEEQALWNRLFYGGHQLMAKASDAGATDAELALVMGLKPAAIAGHLSARKRRQESARRARLSIERHSRSRLWRWWYELCWRAFWGDERKNAIMREKGEQVPESPFIENLWELAEREGYGDDELQSP